MRYFQIFADTKNPQPQFLDWYQRLKPKRWQDKEVYDALKRKNDFPVELKEEIEFLDVISSPYFMVSKEFANLIRLYDSNIRFKKVLLFEKSSKRSVLYQVPRLPEVDCLSQESELNRDKSVILQGVLSSERIKPYPIFRLGGVSSRCILANLELVESAFHRKVMGMKIREFVVR